MNKIINKFDEKTTNYILGHVANYRKLILMPIIKKLLLQLEEEISCIDADYQGEDYRKGFNETKEKAIKIIKSYAKSN